MMALEEMVCARLLNCTKGAWSIWKSGGYWKD